MKSFLKLLLVVFSLILFSQCKTSSKTTDQSLAGDVKVPSQYPGRLIFFGTGGGFSGKVQQWTLLDNGTLMGGKVLTFVEDFDFEGDQKNAHKIEQQLTDQMFHLYDEMGFAELELNEPGNLYYFIKMQDQDGVHELIWGDKKHPLLARYHQVLYKLARSKQPKGQNKAKVVK